MLAKEIRRNRNINGIVVNNTETKLSQFADDITLILDGSRESLIGCLQTLLEFFEGSGLKLNDKKNGSPLDRLNVGAMKYHFPKGNLTGQNIKLRL